MGLDMYLKAENFFWTHEENESINEARKMIADALQLKTSEVQSVSLNIGYWRKANWIHNWFVQNVQNGDDDCSQYFVTREQLAELKQLCDQLVASKDVNKAYTLLPPVEGFFFGNDDHYWESLDYTSKIINDILTRPQLATFDLYYQSSW